MEEVYGFDVFGVNEASETERRRSLSGDSDAAAPAGPARPGEGESEKTSVEASGGKGASDGAVQEGSPAPSSEPEQMVEVAVPRKLFRAILERIRRLKELTWAPG